MAKPMRFTTFLAGFALAALAGGGVLAFAGGDDEKNEGDAATLKGLPTSKRGLLDAIRQAAPAPAAAISAKFEDEGKGLSLSVYVAAKGLGVDAEGNVLEEVAGSPTSGDWKPETEVFKDVEHVARSAEQATLMRLTRLTLADVIAKAGRAQSGTVFSVSPAVRGGKGVFLVRVASEGKAVDLALDLSTGEPIRPEK